MTNLRGTTPHGSLLYDDDTANPGWMMVRLTVLQFERNCACAVAASSPLKCSCFEAGRDPMCPVHGQTGGDVRGW